MNTRRMIFSVTGALLLALAPVLSAQGQRIPSTQAFVAGCNPLELGGVDITIDYGLGSSTFNVPSPARTDPEWAVVVSDGTKSPLEQPPQVVEGYVTIPDFTPTSASPGNLPTSDYQATAEVAEEDFAWTHFTHDYTFKLTPDPAYEHVLTYYQNAGGGIGFQPDMEVEWENASYMDEKEGFQRIWGGLPEFAWPSYGDRIWLMGQWIFDCGHPGSTDSSLVRYETEIHPPRAIVTQRLFHTALDSFPRQRVSEPSYPEPQSYLPVTGVPEAGSQTYPTWVQLTEADIFVSGNGGLANDLCSLVPTSPPYTDFGPVLNGLGYTACGSGHTSPVIPVNDRNYVFDIYPPVTDYTIPDTAGGASTLINGNQVFPWTVYPPTPDASLQYRIVDHDSELPAHACGGTDTSNCVTVAPIICLIDDTTPPPNQSETSCPALPARPTRLRVILPFKGTNANYFAKTIMLGWDDVPHPDDDVARVRTFKVSLHSFHINENGSGPFNDGDWRLFLNLNGQWRYMSPYFDTDAFGGKGIHAFDGGDNVCSGTALTENGDDDCFHFDNTPFIVTTTQEEPIYIGVGGFIARDVESSGNWAFMCRNYPGGCDPRVTFSEFLDLATSNDDRIGTQEWRLVYRDGYGAPNAESSTVSFGCSIKTAFGCNIQYSTTFTVDEIFASTAPSSGDPIIGTPKYAGTAATFITSATPLTLAVTGGSASNFQYRFHKHGGALPTFASTLPFPVHWTSTALTTATSADVSLSGGNAAGDGVYDLQYSAEQDWHLLEPRHTSTLILDNTPPSTTLVQPSAGATFGRGSALTLDYTVDDGTGSGVQGKVPTMDGETAAQFGASLDSGQTIYLYSMPLGTHTFAVAATDNLGNAATKSAAFTIAVTPDSLNGDVANLTALGCVDNISQALTAKISAAQDLIGKGQTQAAVNTLAALIQQVEAQAGKHIATACTDPNHRSFDPVQLLLEDARYLQATVGGQLSANPILGWVVNAGGTAIGGVAVNLLDASSTVVATATTDATGFYYFASGGLTSGANYTLRVTLPAGYTASMPALLTFTWAATSVFGNFTLN